MTCLHKPLSIIALRAPRCFWMVLMALFTASPVLARERSLFDSDWRFLLADSARMSAPDYDDGHWRRLNLPHDWAIEGDFRADNPSGASGGALPGGVGWYRKHFALGHQPTTETDRYTLTFDGVYMNSTVYVNGHRLGTRPYGYISFEYDMTPYLKKGDNVVAVRVDNGDQPNSRWYSGCGIYRHVWLTRTSPLHFVDWGTHVVADEKGRVAVRVEYAGNVRKGARPSLRTTIYDAEGRRVASRTSSSTRQNLKVARPELWSVDHPYVYKVKVELLVGGKLVDEYLTTTGFRSFRFDASTGFWLNGKNMKINGVCLHHDLGCLGAALHEDALHRQLLRMKQMGVNGIRCSHNPPAPELLNMCDTMGFVVMDEAFDMWRRKKTKNDYARFFDEWHERDLTDLVRRDRNHPCIAIWSIGNEVLEQWSSAEADTLSLEQANLILNAGHQVDSEQGATAAIDHPNQLMTRHLADIVRRNLSIDGAIDKWPYGQVYVSAGCNEPSPGNHLFKSGALDIIGFNYHRQWVKGVPEKFPGKPFLMTESVSALQTRGYYSMPSDVDLKAPKEWWLPFTNPSFSCPAYDNMHASWSSTHEQTWDIVKRTPYCGGQFIWTGFDYIGEPTPYGFPARSSYFGIVDLAGMPKDAYYMYQSEWTEEPVLHLFPHWDWLPGDSIDMWCYFNQADEVELFINGKSQGVRRKADVSPEPDTVTHRIPLCTPYHVAWRVCFEPGEARAVARLKGREVASQVVRTAGQPHHIRLRMDYDGRLRGAGRATSGRPAVTQEIVRGADVAVPKFMEGDSAGRSHLVYVEADVVDKDGNLCPYADNTIFFQPQGCSVAGVDNGCPYSMERFKADHRKAFHGRCIVVLSMRPGEEKPVLKARAVDLQSAEMAL